MGGSGERRRPADAVLNDRPTTADRVDDREPRVCPPEGKGGAAAQNDVGGVGAEVASILRTAEG